MGNRKLRMKVAGFKSARLILWVAFLFFLCGVGAFAWSSRNCPLFEPVHQMAIQAVLSNQVSAVQLQILQDQQTVVDEDQAAAQSYEHAMTGILSNKDS